MTESLAIFTDTFVEMGLTDTKFMGLCNEIDNSTDLELISKNKSKFIELLKLIQGIQEGIDFDTDAIEQFDLNQRKHNFSKHSRIRKITHRTE